MGMSNKLKIELLNHLYGTLNERSDLETGEDLHNEAFNIEPYVYYYYNAEQWLESHKISAFDAIADIIEWELEVLGEVHLKPEKINPEDIVTLFAYIKGGEILSEFDLDKPREELLIDLENAIKELEND